MPQQVEEKPKKRKKQEKKLEFEAGKGFTPGGGEEGDFELELGSARFKGGKGEGGGRRARTGRGAGADRTGVTLFCPRGFPPPRRHVG